MIGARFCDGEVAARTSTVKVRRPIIEMRLEFVMEVPPRVWMNAKGLVPKKIDKTSTPCSSVCLAWNRQCKVSPADLEFLSQFLLELLSLLGGSETDPGFTKNALEVSTSAESTPNARKNQVVGRAPASRSL